MNRLEDKRALITGGTSGIGLETARQFLNEGVRLAITGTNPATIEAARAELGGDVVIIRADAGNVAAQQEIANAVREAFGGLDAVFMNAGVADLRPIEQWDEAGFDRSIAINLKGPLFSFRRCCPFWRIRPRSCSTPRSTRISACRTRASRGHESRPPVTHSHAFGRTDVARHPRQRGQPRSDLDAAL